MECDSEALRKSLAIFQCCCATIASMNTFCLPGCYCNRHGSQVNKAIDRFSPTAACITPSGTINASQQGGSSQMYSKLIFMYPFSM